MNKRLLALLLATILLVLAGCSGSTTTTASSSGTSATQPTASQPPAAASKVAAPAAQKPIKIGVAHPLSGTLAMEGNFCLKGSQFAVKEFNDAGGLNGRMAEIASADTQGTPTESVNAVEKLITVDNVCALTGCFTSTGTAAVFPILEKHGVLMVNNVSSSPALVAAGCKWFFHSKMSNDDRSAFFGKFIADNLHANSVAMLAVNDDFGRTGVETHKAIFEADGVKVPVTEFFESGETNFQAVMTKIKNSGCDVLFLVAEVQDGAMVMRQYYELGMKQAVCSIGSLATKQFFDLAGSNADGIYNAECYADGIDNPENIAFIEAYKAEYGEVPSNYDLSGYMEARCILEAIKIAGSDDRDAIREAMFKVNFQSPIGPCYFDEQGQARTNLYISVNENGTATVKAVWDSEHKVSTLVN